MPLPVTITGLSTVVPIAGPFKVAAGTPTGGGAIIAATTFNTVAGGFGTGATTGIYQTLTAGGSPLIISSVSVAMYRQGTPTGTCYVQIYDQALGGSVVATSSLVDETTVTATGSPGQKVIFTFPTPPTISAGASFTVMVRRTAGNTSDYFQYPISNTNPYAGGIQGNWDGSSWAQNTSSDLGVIINPTVIAADAYYLFGRNGTTATTLSAYKATAPDTSWASIATKTGFTTAILNLTSYQVGTTIHLAVQDGTASTLLATKYVSFDTTNDTFLATTETISAAVAVTGQIAGAGAGASIVVRGNGEVVAFYSGVQTKTSGTFRSRVYYRRRTAVNTWSAETQVDANTAVDTNYPVAVLGAADRVHLCWGTAPTSAASRTLSAANALSVINGAGSFPNPGDGVSYDRAGVTKIVITNNTTGQAVMRYDSSDNPAPSVTSSVATAVNATVPHRIGVDTETDEVTIVYRNSADSDLYAIKSTNDGANWGTAASFFVGTVASADANVSRSPSGSEYQRGATIVIGYVVNDNGTLKYNESVVRTLSSTGTGTLAAQASVLVSEGRVPYEGPGVLVAQAAAIVTSPPGVSGSAGTGVLTATPLSTYNYVSYSQELNNFIWTRDNLSIVADSATAPDGTLTAETITSTAANSDHILWRDAIAGPPAGTYVLSFYVKAGTGNWIQIWCDGYWRNFNLTDGSLGYGAGGSGGTCTDAGNGWWRCSISYPKGGLGFSPQLAILDANVNQSAGSYAHGVVLSIYAWGAQYEVGSLPTTYIPTGSTGAALYKVLVGTGIAAWNATGTLPSSGATLVGVGAVAEAPTGTGVLIADVAVLAGVGEVTTPVAEATGTGVLVPTLATRTNLALHSQNILTSGTSWFGGAITATSNSTTGADGTLTAERLTDNASPSVHQVMQFGMPTEVGKTYTFSVYVKAGTLSWFQLQSPSDSAFGNFNVSSPTLGVLGQKSANCTTKIEPTLISGYHRCSLTVTVGNASSSIAILLLTGDNTDATYVGTGQYLYVWGAQVEQGDRATTYIPTTTAIVTAGTVLNGVGIRQAAPPTGTGVLQAIQAYRANNVLQSQTLEHSSWTLFNATVTANDIAAPDATLTADKITDTTSTAQHCIYQDRSATQPMGAGTFTMSVYGKMGTLKWLVLAADAGAYDHRAVFNLETGVVGSKSQFITSSAITSVGDGWHRCTFTFSTPVKPEYIYIFASNADNLNPSYTGTGNGTIYAWGVQLEPGDVATAYIQTTTAPVTIYPVMGVGLAETAGVTGTGALVPQSAVRTNLLKQSQNIFFGDWFNAASSAASNVTAAPDSTTTAESLTDNGSNTSHYTYQFGIPLEGGKTYTASIYVKAGTLSWVRLDVQVTGSTFANFNVSTGVVGQKTAGVTAQIVDAGNGWWRCSLQSVAATPDAFGLFSIFTMPADNAASGYVGTLKNLYLWGAQFEEGAVATAYIPTTTAPASVGKVLTGSGNVVWLASGDLLAGAAALSGTGTVVIPAVATTFDPAKSGTKMALSNGNLTATKSGSGIATALSIPSVGTKVYAEVIGNVAGSFTAVGLADDNFAYETTMLGTPLAVGYQADGKVYVNNVVVASIGLFNDGDRVAVALDVTTQMFSVRNITKGDAWITPTATGYAASTALRLGFSGLFSGSRATAQFTGAMVGTPPGEGYTQWNGEALPAAPAIGTGVLVAATAALAGVGTVAEAPSGVTLDPAKTSSRFTLSDGNLTATFTGTSGYGSSMSQFSSGTSRMYAEVVAVSGGHNGNTGYGVTGDPSGFEGGWLGAGPSSVALYGDGSIYRNAGVVGAGPAFAPGDRIAVDATNNPATVAFRNITTGSAWTTAYTFAHTNGQPLVFGKSAQSVNSKGTFTFNNSIVGTPPVGATQWNGQPFGVAEATGTGALLASVADLDAFGVTISLGTAALAAVNSVVSGGGSTGSLATATLSSNASVVAGTGLSSSRSTSAALLDAAATLAAAGISSSHSTAAALPAGAATLAAAGVNRWVATGTLPSSFATLAGAGVATHRASGTLPSGAADLDAVGAVAWRATGTLPAQAATIVAPGISSSASTLAALQSAVASVNGSEGVSIITGTGTVPSQSATLASAGLSSSSGTAILSATASNTASVAVSGSLGTAALLSQAASVTGAGVARWVATGVLPAQAATITSAGVARWVATGTLPAGSFTAVGLGQVRFDANGALNSYLATIASAGLSSSTATAALLASVAYVSGFEGVTVVSGTGTLPAQSHTLAGAGLGLSSGTSVLLDAASALAGAGLTGSLATGALISQPCVISSAGMSSSAGTGAITAVGASVFGLGNVAAAPTGTGVLTAGSASAIGVGGAALTASGILTAQNATLAGAGKSITTGTSALVSPSAALDAVGLTAWRATGTLISSASDVDGTGIRQWTGTGGLAPQAALLVGAGRSGWAATGALTVSSAALAGAGLSGWAASGTLVSSAADADGAGLSSVTGTAVLTPARATIFGAEGTVVIFGTGALQAQSRVMVGLGVSRSFGTGSLSVADSSEVLGAGVSRSTGTGALPAGQSDLDGVAVARIEGAGALAAGESDIASTGGIARWTATGALSSPVSVLVAEGASGSRGTSVLLDARADLDGAGVTGATGTGDLDARVATVFGSAVLSTSGTGVLVAQDNDVVGTGLSTSRGTGALTQGRGALDADGITGSRGTSVIAAQPARLIGFASLTAFGSGDLDALPAAVNGNDLVVGTGAIAAQFSTLNGVGAVGAYIAPPPTQMPGGYPGTLPYGRIAVVPPTLSSARPTLPPPGWWLGRAA